MTQSERQSHDQQEVAELLRKRIRTGDQAPKWSTIEITAADLLGLAQASGPPPAANEVFDLLPAQGPGTFVIPNQVVWVISDGTAYTGSPTLKIGWRLYGQLSQASELRNALTAASSAKRLASHSIAGSDIYHIFDLASKIENQPLSVWIDGGFPFVGGNRSVVAHILYVVATG